MKTILTPEGDFEMRTTQQLLNFLRWQIETEASYAAKCPASEKSRVKHKIACLLTLRAMVLEVSK